MAQAIEGDNLAMDDGLPAFERLRCLDKVLAVMRRHGNQESVKESLLEEIRAFIQPYEDKRTKKSLLPPVRIRDELIGLLHSSYYKDLDPLDHLVPSQIGKVFTHLRGHPKETAANKRKMAEMSDYWSRLIYQKAENKRSSSKEARAEAEAAAERSAAARRKRRRSSEGGAAEPAAPKAGERGFIQRARVPKEATFEFTSRPKSIGFDLEEVLEMEKAAKKTGKGILDTIKRQGKGRSSAKGQGQAVRVNISGGK